MCNCTRAWYQIKFKKIERNLHNFRAFPPTNSTSPPTSPPIPHLTLYCCAHSNSFHWHTTRVLVYWIRLGV